MLCADAVVERTNSTMRGDPRAERKDRFQRALAVDEQPPRRLLHHGLTPPVGIEGDIVAAARDDGARKGAPRHVRNGDLHRVAEKYAPARTERLLQFVAKTRGHEEIAVLPDEFGLVGQRRSRTMPLAEQAVHARACGSR